MVFAARTMIFALVFFLVVIVGGCALQVFLSRREAWWPGLVLPALTLLYSLFVLLNLAAPASWELGTVVSLLLSVLTLNLPTLVLLAIYFICRSGQRRKKQLEKMDIQDL